jgi:polar amino acid transport system ATP-binding protein
VQGLVKAYHDRPVLDGIDLDVREHEVVVLIGASGSGKSTLLRCIDLLEDIDDGRILLDGRDISDPRIDGDEARRAMGMVFQSFNLFPHMTALQNVALAPRFVHGSTRHDAQERGRELLARVGLSEKADAYPDKLSGGQQQRVAIARALAYEPKKWRSPARWPTRCTSSTAVGSLNLVRLHRFWPIHSRTGPVSSCGVLTGRSPRARWAGNSR